MAITLNGTTGITAPALDLDTPLPVADGGTGATSNAATSYALKGANSDITSLSGLSTALSVAQGGTNNASLAVTAGGVVYTDGSKLVNVGAGTSGQVLQSNGASAPTWGTAGGGLTGFEKLTSTQTWTVPAGITKVLVELCGGGGGGSTSNDYTGGGGGYAKGMVTVTPGASITATVGAGGSGAGSSGGTSSFSTVSATGGTSGIYYSPGIGGSGTGTLSVSGSGGQYSSNFGAIGGLVGGISQTFADLPGCSVIRLTNLRGIIPGGNGSGYGSGGYRPYGSCTATQGVAGVILLTY